jgi:hypothetical protein
MSRFKDRCALVVQLMHRCGDSLEELRLQNMEVNGHLANAICNFAPRLKHLDLRFCDLDERAVLLFVNGLEEKLQSLMLLETDCWQVSGFFCLTFSGA